MTLPEGFVLKPYNDDKVYLLSSNQADDLTCTVSNLEGNTYRVMLYSNTLQNHSCSEFNSVGRWICQIGICDESVSAFIWPKIE